MAAIAAMPPVISSLSEGEAAEGSGEKTVEVPKLLIGRKINDLFTLYTGVRGSMPEKINANFPTVQLPKLWEVKSKRFKETEAVRETKENLIKTYSQNKSEKMGWKDYRVRAQTSINSIRDALDWSAVGKEFGIKEDGLPLLRALEGQIAGSHLLAYCLTELMPSTDGAFNREILEFLLRQGGRDYVERIPAIHDPKVSFGPYQFTEYALKDFGDGTKKSGSSILNEHIQEKEKTFLEKILGQIAETMEDILPDWEGISAVNKLIKVENLRIPGSVAKLHGDDHHKAAYLFAIHNLAMLVRALNPADRATILGRADELKAPIAEYIATAHNLPSVALIAFKDYLTAFLGRNPRLVPEPKRKTKTKIPVKGKKNAKPKNIAIPIKLGRDADYLEHFIPRKKTKGKIKAYARVKLYGLKTRVNFKAVSN